MAAGVKPSEVSVKLQPLVRLVKGEEAKAYLALSRCPRE